MKRELTMPEPAYLPLDRVLRKRKDGAWDAGTVTKVVIDVLADAGDQAPEIFTGYHVKLDRETRKKILVCEAHELSPHPAG